MILLKASSPKNSSNQRTSIDAMVHIHDVIANNSDLITEDESTPQNMNPKDRASGSQSPNCLPQNMFLTKLSEIGLDQEKMEAVIELANEQLSDILEAIFLEWHWHQEQTELIQHFGGVQRWNMVSRQLKAWGEANLTKELFECLTCSAKGLLAIENMMRKSEPMLVSHDAGENTVMTERALKGAIKDPRYWKSKDPAYIASVTEAFKSLYDERR